MGANAMIQLLKRVEEIRKQIEDSEKELKMIREKIKLSYQNEE